MCNICKLAIYLGVPPTTIMDENGKEAAERIAGEALSVLKGLQDNREWDGKEELFVGAIVSVIGRECTVEAIDPVGGGACVRQHNNNMLAVHHFGVIKPVVKSSVIELTESAKEFNDDIQDWYTVGWTDEQLVEHGFGEQVTVDREHVLNVFRTIAGDDIEVTISFRESGE